MNVLCSFPGKFGDVLWALPAIRALSRRIGQPVDLLLSYDYMGLCPLLVQQSYLGDVHADSEWRTQNTAPMSPRVPPNAPEFEDYDAVFHLGYRGWPSRPLPYETLDCLNESLIGVPAYGPGYHPNLYNYGGLHKIPDDELCLTEPWIRMKRSHELAEVHRCDLAIAFTDEHFELKFGLSILVVEQLGKPFPTLTHTVLCPAGSRWATETRAYPALSVVDWQGYANIIADAELVLADCSAAHVLAIAMGKPVVLMEPNPQRHNSIFYPLGTDGHVLVVKGMDGQPTFHAPHVTDVLKAFYESAKAVQH